MAYLLVVSLGYEHSLPQETEVHQDKSTQQPAIWSEMREARPGASPFDASRPQRGSSGSTLSKESEHERASSDKRPRVQPSLPVEHGQADEKSEGKHHHAEVGGEQEREPERSEYQPKPPEGQ